MLAVCKCLSQEFNVGIMRRCNIDNVDLRICKHLMKVIIYLCYMIFLCKCNCLLMGTVSYRI